MVLGKLFGDDDDEISATRKKQMEEARKRERRMKIEAARERVTEAGKKAKNLATTGTTEGGTGERVPGFVNSPKQKRKRQFRKAREKVGEGVSKAREVGEDIADDLDESYSEGGEGDFMGVGGVGDAADSVVGGLTEDESRSGSESVESVLVGSDSDDESGGVDDDLLF